MITFNCSSCGYTFRTEEPKSFANCYICGKTMSQYS